MSSVKELIIFLSILTVVSCNCCLRFGQRANQFGQMQVYCQIPFPCLGGVNPPMIPQGNFPSGLYPQTPESWGTWGTSNIPFPGYPGNSRGYLINRNIQVQPNLQTRDREIVTNTKLFSDVGFIPRNDPKNKRPEEEATNEITGNNCQDGLNDNCSVRIEKL